MFRQSRFIAIVALAVSALAASTRPALAEADGASVRQSVANATPATVPTFLVKGLAANSAAQDPQSSNGNPRHEGLGIGAEIGPIFSGFDAAQENLKGNTGFEGGIFFGGNRPGTVGVMGKLLYAVKGGDGTKLHYLEIPILLRVNAGSNSLNGVLVYFLGGPAFDILLKGSQNGVNVKKNYQSLDIAVQFGAGVEITRFFVEGMYTKGLKNVLDSGGANAIDIKTHSFALLVGVRFN
jgi:hypothetical protein